jgi:hypothetical protein
MITPSVGGHYHQPFAISQVDKGAGTRFTASSPCGRQEQGPASDDPRTDQSSRVTVDELMELEIGKLQRSGGGVAHESHSLAHCPAVTMMIVPPAPEPHRIVRIHAAESQRLASCLLVKAGQSSSPISIVSFSRAGPVKGWSWLCGVDAARTDRGRAGAPGGGTGDTRRGRSPPSGAPPCGS